MAPRKTLNDVVEQLKANNETSVDISQGIAGLENQFGKFFTDLRRRQLEDSREAKAARQTAGVAPMKSSSGGGSGGFLGGLSKLGKLGFMGMLGAIAGGITLGAIGILKALGPAGVGLAAFFIGLATAEVAIQKFTKADAGSGLKNLLKNLAEGLGAFGKKEFIAFGSVLAAGVIFPKRTAIGLPAVGLGLAGFFTAMAGADKLMQMMNGDQGANLKALMINFSAGLSAFNLETFTMLGSLLGAGAIFGATGLAGPAAFGIGAIGVGIGAFIVALGGISKLGAVLGVDGSSFKVLMTNLAGGLQELAKVESEGLLKKVGALAGLGPALISAMVGTTAVQALDGLINGAKKVINFITFGTAGLEDQATARKGMIRDLVDAMKPLNEIPDNLGTQLDLLSSGLLKFVKSFNKAANDLDIKQITKTFLELGATLSMTRNLVFAMANGGEFKKPGFMNKIARGLGLGGKIEFGEEGSGGLLDPTLKTDDLVKQVQKINFTLGKTSSAPEISPQNYPDRIQNMAGDNSAGDVNMLNSNNRTVTTNNNAGVVLDNSGAIDRQDNLSNQIKNPSNLF